MDEIGGMASSPSYKIKREENGGGDGGGGAALLTPPPVIPPAVEDPSRKRARPPGKHSATGSKVFRIAPNLFYWIYEKGWMLELEREIGNLEPTIESIKAKYGDIEKDCDLKSEVMRKVVVSGICNVLKELHKLKIEELNVDSLEKYYEAVKDAEKIKIDVKWLRPQLDKIKEAINSKVGAKGLIAERDVQKNKLKEQEEELKTLNIRKQNLEKEMVLTTAKIQSLDKDISSRTYDFAKFKSLAFFNLFR
ncbi:hypothetical protein BUALT_Bualt10G0047200 [Buddleja alternifolia]|uniref:Uncharacterized protein n=1 Tax=Buddleja alternifolia TaxID=168488 RepID=A0AAV6WXU9_9LAMI|nr:hypothetical protein BUALT_Bualt10G0047200 [Buddleja alternifolia]